CRLPATTGQMQCDPEFFAGASMPAKSSISGQPRPCAIRQTARTWTTGVSAGQRRRARDRTRARSMGRARGQARPEPRYRIPRPREPVPLIVATVFSPGIPSRSLLLLANSHDGAPRKAGSAAFWLVRHGLLLRWKIIADRRSLLGRQ